LSPPPRKLPKWDGKHRALQFMLFGLNTQQREEVELDLQLYEEERAEVRARHDPPVVEPEKEADGDKEPGRGGTDLGDALPPAAGSSPRGDGLRDPQDPRRGEGVGRPPRSRPEDPLPGGRGVPEPPSDARAREEDAPPLPGEARQEAREEVVRLDPVAAAFFEAGISFGHVQALEELAAILADPRRGIALELVAVERKLEQEREKSAKLFSHACSLMSSRRRSGVLARARRVVAGALAGARAGLR